MIDKILERIEATSALSFAFGHTPVQMEYFQTINQSGQEKWEYWQHVLQLKALYNALKESEIAYNEVAAELAEAKAFWPIWNRKKRRQRVPRLVFKLDNLLSTQKEKGKEADYHLHLIDTKYSHLKDLTEDDIIKEDVDYWTHRLGRQLGAAYMSRVLGISEGEVLSLLSLPSAYQKEVLTSMQHVLGKAKCLLPERAN